MRRRAQFLSLIALCAMALLFGMWAIASAESPTTTTTTTSASSSTSDSSTTTSSTATTESTTTTTDVDWMRVSEIDITEFNLVPSFISIGNGRLAWTGITPGGYSGMYIYNPLTQTNTKIPEPLPGNYYNPSSDGALVVYQGGRAGGYDDIYLYDTGNGVVRQLTHNTDPGDGNDWNPRIDDGRVVWEKHMLGTGAKSGIYLYDMNEGTAACILEGEAYHDPDVSGNYVVCVKSAESGNGSEIILYNTKTQEATSIAASSKNNEHPRIDAGHVVWSSGDEPSDLYYPWNTYQIKLYYVASGITETLTDNEFGNLNPSIKGDLIVWEQLEPSGIGVLDYVRNFIGLFNEGDPVRAPEADDNFSFAYYGDNTLYYASNLANGPLFIDVGANDPYSPAITAMAEKKILEGYSGDDEGYFGPNDPVTRQQFAKMILLTMAQWKPNVYTPTLRDEYTFADSSAIEHSEGELYAYHYVAKAARTGLTKGYPDGTFRPLDNISRQQVITMIVRAGGDNLATPPKGWQGVLSYVSPEHGYRIYVAEYNGLTDGIVGGTWGGMSGWDTRLNATRGEVAQMLYNLLNKLQGTN